MSKSRSVAAVCAATVALVAFASATPAMGQWMVNGVTLTGAQTKALAATAAVDESMVLKSAGVTMTCTGSTISLAVQIEASSEGAEGSSLTFSGCSANENCKVASTFSFNRFHIRLHKRFPFILILGLPSKTLATIKFEGEKCALLGTQPVTGKATIGAPTFEEERTSQEIESKITEASNELKVGSGAAELKGKQLLRLASGESWSFL
jgi:hypothetical protein